MEAANRIQAAAELFQNEPNLLPAHGPRGVPQARATQLHQRRNHGQVVGNPMVGLSREIGRRSIRIRRGGQSQQHLTSFPEAGSTPPSSESGEPSNEL